MVKKITENTKYMMMGYIFVVGSVVAYYSKLFIQTGVEEWYQLIYHPFLAPANFFFPIAWLLADILLGAAFFLIIIRLPTIEFAKYNYPFLGQLIMQFLWCYVFFYCRWLGVGLMLMIPFTVMAFRTIRTFRDGDPQASAILYPYFVFIIYTTLVNMSFVNEHGLTAIIYM